MQPTPESGHRVSFRYPWCRRLQAPRGRLRSHGVGRAWTGRANGRGSRAAPMRKHRGRSSSGVVRTTLRSPVLTPAVLAAKSSSLAPYVCPIHAVTASLEVAEKLTRTRSQHSHDRFPYPGDGDVHGIPLWGSLRALADARCRQVRHLHRRSARRWHARTSAIAAPTGTPSRASESEHRLYRHTAATGESCSGGRRRYLTTSPMATSGRTLV